MSDLIPERRVDKNGNTVTRWVKASSEGNVVHSIPAPRSSAPTRAERQKIAEELVDFAFSVRDEIVYDIYGDQVPFGKQASLSVHCALVDLKPECLMSLKGAYDSGTSYASKDIVANIMYRLGYSNSTVSMKEEKAVCKLMAEQAEMFVTLMDTRFQKIREQDPMNIMQTVTRHVYRAKHPDIPLSDQTEAALKLALMFPEDDIYIDPQIVKDMVRDGERILASYDPDNWDVSLIKERRSIDVDLLNDAGNNHGGIRSGTL